MAGRTHVLAMIHGITPESEPNVLEQYAPFRRALEAARLPFASICPVEWGVPDSRTGAVERPDQFLLGAEREIAKRVEYRELRREKASPSNELASGIAGRDWGIPGFRQIFRFVREGLVQYGLADAVYYASPEGERAVRDAVFSQVLGQIERAKDGEVHLHLVGHSLGVTIVHDFLFSLFGPREPDFPRQTAKPDAKHLHALWRAEADAGRLKLGTFISFASQLPLFMMRKQSLVERFARGERLDPRDIGIDPQRKSVQWAIFYDADEILGFASRGLYEDTPAIHDIQVNSGLEPLSSHLGYWNGRRVIARTLEILRANTVEPDDTRYAKPTSETTRPMH